MMHDDENPNNLLFTGATFRGRFPDGAEYSLIGGFQFVVAYLKDKTTDQNLSMTE